MRRTMIVCLLCVLASLALMFYGLWMPDRSPFPTPKIYAYIIADDIGTTAMQHKQGLQQAASELDVEIRTFTAEKNAAQSQQLLSFLNELKESDIDGIILSECGPDVSSRATEIAAEMEVPLACLFEIQEPGVFSLSVDEALGRALAQAADNAAPTAVLAGNGSASQRRLAGASAVLAAPFAHYESITALPPSLRGIQLLVLTPEWLANLPAGGVDRILSTDPGDTRASLLETGRIDALAIRMPYAEGYLALSALHANAQYGGPVFSIECPVRVVTAETLYNSENVKLMFPLLQ
ncbi:MAG: hypothetical protein FWG37_02760 [Clostridia bacterium]|nr:hypothetical protein [Clostridia bacterium]